MATATEKLELRREVTVWGSYMWGYADVGADIYAALGLVMLWAKGATSLAFALAGLVYIMIGLAYNFSLPGGRNSWPISG
ncbi:MAG: basic amino acid/polyamine antiporter, family [Moorella sp. (in: firmicutes)]|uniref:Uncharacterized protein n=1 Tax=Neomoorella thermoacetica TaxID=1525 RepID=A0A1J5NY70_NEOTH|nr:basic amino acid/polyamine antiporter, family [Moorella sp. (in: firmicutes)]OIQ60687.1 hypothetical protein MOTE_06510 [Moorella thermoacetica]